jgi:hypothetical protein
MRALGPPAAVQGLVQALVAALQEAAAELAEREQARVPAEQLEPALADRLAAVPARAEQEGELAEPLAALAANNFIRRLTVDVWELQVDAWLGLRGFMVPQQ